MQTTVFFPFFFFLIRKEAAAPHQCFKSQGQKGFRHSWGQPCWIHVSWRTHQIFPMESQKSGILRGREVFTGSSPSESNPHTQSLKSFQNILLREGWLSFFPFTY